MAKKYLTVISTLFILSFWPLSLFLSNLPSDFIHYLTSPALLTCFYLLYKRNHIFYPLPLLAIPFFEPKLALLPFIIFLLLGKNKINLTSLAASFFILIITFSAFQQQTVFHPDHNGYQKVIQNTQQYNNILEARLMHNKARVYLDKINNNFFALTDPNNYFFGFHPREIIIDNQNLKKFPIFSIIFFLIALFNLKNFKNNSSIFVISVATLIDLSLLSVFDRTDFILYPVISIVIIYGLNIFNKYKYAPIFHFAFLVFTLPEFLKNIIDLLK